MTYAELQVTTNFSFLRGASHGEELVAQAKALGLSAIAVTDRNTLAGVVRAHIAAKQVGLQLIVGARLDLQDAPSLLCLPRDRAAYGRLARLLSVGQMRAEKGKCTLFLDDVAQQAEGQIFIALAPDDWDWREVEATPTADIIPFVQKPFANTPTPVFPPSPSKGEGRGGGEVIDAIGTPHPVPPPQGGRGRKYQRTPSEQRDRDSFEAALRRIKAAVGESPLYLAASHTYRGDDRARIAALGRLAERCATPLIAAGDVLYHAAHRRPLQDVLTCVREGTTIGQAGLKLEANAERHLKPPQEMARLFKGYEAAVARTVQIAEACRFLLDELVYEYPDEPIPPGKTPQAHLEDLTWEGARWRFPDGIPKKVDALIRRELELIGQLNYAPYFLTVHDIVHFARSQDILCQGRGSAANSAVCYCLAITAVNPAEIDVLFERFVSPERKEPPDIDVDFEHERREEVIQYIYARYGRDRAGLAATVISYRARSAVRDVGKAMGLSEDTVSALAGMVWGTRSGGALPETHVREAGLDPSDPLIATVLELTQDLMGFPRHLSQHVGGFVLTRGPLVEVVPVGNAAMADRTFIEWDKDDIAALGLLKVDVLALGMLTCIRKAFDLIGQHHDRAMTLANVPREDPAVYDMLCNADSIGVFQVESRAQMNMLPRLRPRTFYDLVIEVAIVRPGPIQGDMVHPYLRRRSGAEAEYYPSPAPEHGPADELKSILGKTKGVPLFQEQAMRIALVAAKFSDAEVNELRKAMATFRRRGTIGLLEEKMVSSMVARGYAQEFAQRCFNQIKGFGEYGFPESHAASFALLVYVSAWIKCHYPAAFAAALLNSQPMGFYAPAQIVRDAREHGVEARSADVNLSDWDCTLEPSGEGVVALRLGLRQIDGLAEEEIAKLIAVRGPTPPPRPSPFKGEGEKTERFSTPLSPPPLRGRKTRRTQCTASGGGGSPSKEEGPCPTNKRAGCAGILHKKSGSSGRSCGTKDSQGIAFADSTQSDPISSISSASNESSSSRSMISSMEKQRGKGAIASARNGSRKGATESCASGTETSGSTFTEPSKRSSAPSSERSEANTPTPTLPLPGGGRENERSGHAKPFRDVHDLWLRAGLKLATLERLAAADAFRSIQAELGSAKTDLDRRQALWEVKALKSTEPLPLFTYAETREAGSEPVVALPEMALSEHVVNDYQTLRLSLKAHPMSFLRERFAARRVRACHELRHLKDGAYVSVAGVVLVRQRPGSAKGVVFMTIEDETGIANAVVWPKTLERYRKVVMAARLIVIHGRIQRHEDIIHVVSARLEDRSDWLRFLSEDADQMKAPVANADHIRRPEQGSRSPSRQEAHMHPRWAGHPRNERVIPKSRDFH